MIRRRAALLAAGLTIATGFAWAALVGCVDTLHSTDFTPCSDCVDASTGEAEAAAPIELCAPSPAEAKKRAARACARLGACAGPLGTNAYGSCYYNALQIFDCDVRPGRRPRGEAKRFWACLQAASGIEPLSCGRVTDCFPKVQCSPVPPRDRNTAVCDEAKGLRILCPPGSGAAPTMLEHCPGVGRACPAALGECAVSTKSVACATSGCEGTASHVCDGADDRGVDCAYFGAGTCGAGSCVLEDAGACAAPVVDDGGPADAIRCSAGIAMTCPVGQRDAIDCGAFGFTCEPQPATAGASDVSLACKGQDAGACTDRCSGTVLTSCFRNLAFVVDCNEHGLSCKSVTVTTGDVPTCSR